MASAKGRRRQPKLIPPLFPLLPSVQNFFAHFCGPQKGWRLLWRRSWSMLSGTRFRSSLSGGATLRDGIRQRTSAAAKTDSPFVSFVTFCSKLLCSLLWAAKRLASSLASILEYVVRNPFSKFAIRRGDLERWHPPKDVGGSQN